MPAEIVYNTDATFIDLQEELKEMLRKPKFKNGWDYDGSGFEIDRRDPFCQAKLNQKIQDYFRLSRFKTRCKGYPLNKHFQNKVSRINGLPVEEWVILELVGYPFIIDVSIAALDIKNPMNYVMLRDEWMEKYGIVTTDKSGPRNLREIKQLMRK